MSKKEKYNSEDNKDTNVYREAGDNEFTDDEMISGDAAEYADDKYITDTDDMPDHDEDTFAGNRGSGGQWQEGQYEVTKKRRRVWPWILLAAAGAAAAAVAVWFFMFNKTVSISDYVSVKYDGIDGYATPECVVDRDRLYEAMAGKENNPEKLAYYRGFADSVTASVEGDHISNGDSLNVNVTYDEAAREKTNYKVNNTQFSVTADGIDSGKSMNLFENVSIKINGISPYATMEIVNNNTDEYLKSLEYKTDKAENLKNGDRVTLSCEVTDDELAEHGLTTTALTAMYDVSGLSEYVQSGKAIPRKLMEDKVKRHGEIIDKETKDDTFRMLYKATSDAKYLTVPNNETAADIKQEGIYFLKKKPENKEGNNSENKVAFLHSAKISVGDDSETIYFLFTYDDLFVNADGEYKFISGDEDADYIAGRDKGKLVDDNIKRLESGYTNEQVDLTALSDKEKEKEETTSSEEGNTEETTGTEDTTSESSSAAEVTESESVSTEEIKED